MKTKISIAYHHHSYHCYFNFFSTMRAEEGSISEREEGKKGEIHSVRKMAKKKVKIISNSEYKERRKVNIGELFPLW